MLILTGNEAAKKIHAAFLDEFESLSNFTSASKVKDGQFHSGQKVVVKLHGDDNEYIGVMDKPKKLWVQIDEGQGIKPFVADENCIAMIKSAP